MSCSNLNSLIEISTSEKFVARYDVVSFCSPLLPENSIWYLLNSPHAISETHSKDNESVSILCREPAWFKRGEAEAMHIKRELLTLNRERERHILPFTYVELLPKHWASIQLNGRARELRPGGSRVESLSRQVKPQKQGTEMTFVVA